MVDEFRELSWLAELQLPGGSELSHDRLARQVLLHSSGDRLRVINGIIGLCKSGSVDKDYLLYSDEGNVCE